jgi:hypothetical protein
MTHDRSPQPSASALAGALGAKVSAAAAGINVDIGPPCMQLGVQGSTSC